MKFNKIKIVTLVFVCLSLLVSCESSKTVNTNSGKVPFNPAVKTAVLDNGLTYYVMSNKEPKNRIYIRLVVNAGSCNEDDDQKGIAHLCEHMVFNGTEHFSKDEIDEFLRSIGCEEEDAFTTYLNTVYFFSIPADNKEVFEKAMLIIHDWASSVSFDEEALEKERNIVVEEWRLEQGVSTRINDELFKYELEGSRFLERKIIGDPEIIKNIPRERVIDFYKKWYRPELMSVVVVGDLPQEELENTVINAMKDIPASENKIEKSIYKIPLREKKEIAIYKDKEIKDTLVTIDAQIFDYSPYTTVQQYNQNVLFNFVGYIFNQRINDISKKADSPWISAGVDQTWYTSNSMVIYLWFKPKDGMFKESMKQLIDEYERFTKYGVTKKELERIRLGYNVEMNKYKKGIRKISSEAYSWDLVAQAEDGTILVAPEYYYKLTKEQIKSVTAEDIREVALKYFGNRGDLITITAPESDNGIPSKEQIMKIWTEYKDENISEIVEEKIKEKIMDAPAPAKILSKKKINELGATEYVLQNGVRIITKKTDFEKDQINFSAVSQGGSSLVNDSDFSSAIVSTDYQYNSGIEGFSRTQLDKFFVTKSVDINYAITKEKEYFDGSANNQDIEIALQYVNQIFTNPQFTQEGWDKTMVDYKQRAKNAGNTPSDKFYSKVKEVIYDNSRNYFNYDGNFITSINRDSAERVFKERFGNVADFDFIFVGDFNESKLIDLCCRYLGTIKADASNKEQCKYEYYSLPENKIFAYVNEDTEHKAKVRMVFRGKFQPEADISKRFTEEYVVNLFVNSLNVQLFDYIRKQLGGTYGVNVLFNIYGNPEREYDVNIEFGCEPERMEELSNAIITYLNKLKENGVERKYIEQETERLHRFIETSITKNYWWVITLKNSMVNKSEPIDVAQKYQEEIPLLMTKENFDRIAKEYFDTENYYKVVLMPKK